MWPQFNKPASPNLQTQTLIEGKARNWAFTTILILRDNYQKIIDSEIHKLSQFSSSDWRGPFEIATTWAKGNLGRRLRQDTLDRAQAVIIVRLTETASPPPPAAVVAAPSLPAQAADQASSWLHHHLQRTSLSPRDHGAQLQHEHLPRPKAADIRSPRSPRSTHRLHPCQSPGGDQRDMTSHPANSLQWHLHIHQKTVIIGDSNMCHLPPFKGGNVQMDSFPGARWHHAEFLLKTATF